MKKCRYCGKAMNDSDLFCPRCAREYREDKYEPKAEVDSIFSTIGLDPHDKKGTRRTRKGTYKPTTRHSTGIPPIKLGKNAPLLILGLIMLVVFPPLAPLIIMILVVNLANKIKRDHS